MLAHIGIVICAERFTSVSESAPHKWSSHFLWGARIISNRSSMSQRWVRMCLWHRCGCQKWSWNKEVLVTGAGCLLPATTTTLPLLGVGVGTSCHFSCHFCMATWRAKLNVVACACPWFQHGRESRALLLLSSSGLCVGFWGSLCWEQSVGA